MNTNGMNGILKTYFSKRRALPEKGEGCPPPETVAEYASGALSSDKLYEIGNHVKNCAFCNELMESALLYSAYGKHINIKDIPGRVKNRAKSLNPAYKTKENILMGHFKRNIWFVLCLAALISSFFIPRYFMQLLILAAVFGLKWVFNKESTRALIMIYNTWKKHDKDSDKELEELFKNRL